MEIMKKEQTGKRKGNSKTLRKYVYTKSAELKFNRIVKINENMARKWEAKTKRKRKKESL